jgi:putative FmdB family regulatory protein
MPIYEFACPKCRTIFNFLSKRINPDRLPTCPKCGNEKMEKQLSRFAAISAGKDSESDNSEVAADETGMPDIMNDPRMMRAMGELERDMEHMDENNPRHMAHMMRKMKDLMPPGTMPRELDIAIKRLESGEDPEKIEEEMGDVLGQAFGEEDEGDDGDGGGFRKSSGYSRDTRLYDY